MMHRWCLTILATAIAWAQDTKPPQFEVASIKPVARPYLTVGGPWTADHGRFRAQLGWVRGVIGVAYGVRGGAYVHGGPHWIDTDWYDFEAKAESPDASNDQIRAMIRTLLADRFKLVAHRESQIEQVYVLTVLNGKPKMQKASGQRDIKSLPGPGELVFTEAGMANLTGALASQIGSPVIDETGLKGFYNFKLEFQSNNASPRPLDVDSRPDIYRAVQEQLGLKLDPAKRPVTIIVVDHIERPSEN
jgi:uncharacterized protein (TIGR03435 family)